MNAFTDEQIKEAAQIAAERYLSTDSTEATIEEIKIESKDDEEAVVYVSWDYEDREEGDMPPDDMIFAISVVEGENGDELDVQGPEF